MDATRARHKLVASVLVIVVSALILTFPCIIYACPFYGDDSASNVILFKAFSQQFWSGELYPRWLQQLNSGLGDPSTFYYPPLTYWISSLLKFASLNQTGWRELGWSASIAVMASGLAAFLWLKKIVSRNAALVASLFYLVLPYHSNIDLYNRGALSELWTFVWMPLILAAVDAVIARRRFAFAYVAISYALLIMTHLPTTLIFSTVPVVYALCLSDKGFRFRSLLSTILGMALGIGLAAIYLLPAMTMQRFVFLTTRAVYSHYYFGNWFLFTSLSWSGRKPEYFWAAVEVIALAAGAFVVSWYGPWDQVRRRGLFWFAMALGSFFMMTPLSNPIWQALPPLQNVQFPFRFNTVLSISAAALVAIAFSRNGIRARAALGSVIVLLAGLWIYETAVRAYYAYPVHHFDKSVVEAINKRIELRRDTNEFRPRWVVSIEDEELDALLLHVGTTNGELNKVNVVEGQASVSVQEWSPRQIDLIVDSPSGATLNVSQFYFPGWAVRFDDAVEARAVEPSKPGGLIRVATSAGHHKLTLELTKRWPELVGELTTTLSVLILVGFLLIRKFRVAQDSHLVEAVDERGVD